MRVANWQTHSHTDVTLYKYHYRHGINAPMMSVALWICYPARDAPLHPQDLSILVFSHVATDKYRPLSIALV